MSDVVNEKIAVNPLSSVKVLARITLNKLVVFDNHYLLEYKTC